MLLDAGYEYKGKNDYDEDSYFLGEEIEIGLLKDEAYNAFMISVYSHKVYVMPTKTTWEQHDVKYNTNVKYELDNLIGDANLLPCYDFEKKYYYMPSSSTNSYILMAQNYADNIDERGYYAAISQDLIDLGYVLDSSSGKDVFTYQDQFTVSIDASNRYCTITIKLL